jgi:hypothetical protein
VIELVLMAVVPETLRFLPALAPKLTVSPVPLPKTALPVTVKELSPETVPLKVTVPAPVFADKVGRLAAPKVTASLYV